MNLSPVWIAVLKKEGHEAIHWSAIGSPRAKDREILQWAKERGYHVFTHDLDFGAILAATDAKTPSVIQIRIEEPTPDKCSRLILDVIEYYASALVDGALISVDEGRARVRILPLKNEKQDSL